MSKTAKIIIGAVAAVVAAALLGGGVYLGVYLNRPYINKEKSISFNSPNLTGKDTVIVPASGLTRRNVTAKLFDKEMAELKDNPVTYTMDKEVKGVSLDGNMLTVTSEVSESTMVKVTATDGDSNAKDQVHRTLKVKIKKDPSLKDVPPNPLEKEGWNLYYHDEFDGNELDAQHWSPYYLRHWVDNDERTKANVFLENGSVVLRCSEDMPSWSSQNGDVKARSLMSYERNHLHKFGEVGSGAVFNRNIPTFDGVATKYGYFEVRLRMPNTRDGSHFAWWMVGTQDDQNDTAQLSSEKFPMAGHHSNEMGEFDIIENYISELDQMKAWRPVIHPNGTTDYEYLWVEESEIPGDPSNEYHIYGLEWDETGSKFYVDNKLVRSTDRSPNYRMMTLFTTYATGGMGKDRGIYPKDAYIDYFRIYKKNEASKPSSIALNNYATQDFIRVPDMGSVQVPMTATVLDQFDRPISSKVQWKLSQTIDGFTPTTAKAASLKGVSIDPDTGVLTVQAMADLGQDVFVTAYVSDKVKQTYHIRLSKEDSLPQRILFNLDLDTVEQGRSYDFSAKLYDQYKAPMSFYKVTYQISEDIAGTTQKSIPGVSINSQGKLTVDASVPSDTVIVVTAKAGGTYNNSIVQVN